MPEPNKQDKLKTQRMIRRTILASMLFLLLVPLLDLPLLYCDIHPKFTRENILFNNLVGFEKKGGEPPSLSLGSWIDGSYQKGFLNRYYGTWHPVRRAFIRSINELFYRVFRKSMCNKSVIIGKCGQLFEKGYIDDYCRNIEPISPPNIANFVHGLQRVQKYFSKHGKAFIFVLSPSKASAYPEYIPSNCCVGLYESRSYDLLVPELKKAEINFIDGPAIIKENKHDEALFPKEGTHWNRLGAYYVAQAITQEIEHLRNEPYRQLQCNGIRKLMRSTKIGLNDDRDLGILLNRISTPDDLLNFAPADCKLLNSESSPLSIVIIGTSFNWMLSSIFTKEEIVSDLAFINHYGSPDMTVVTDSSRTKIMQISGYIRWPDILNKDIVVLEVPENLSHNSLQSLQAFIDDTIRVEGKQ